MNSSQLLPNCSSSETGTTDNATQLAIPAAPVDYFDWQLRQLVPANESAFPNSEPRNISAAEIERNSTSVTLNSSEGIINSIISLPWEQVGPSYASAWSACCSTYNEYSKPSVHFDLDFRTTSQTQNDFGRKLTALSGNRIVASSFQGLTIFDVSAERGTTFKQTQAPPTGLTSDTDGVILVQYPRMWQVMTVGGSLVADVQCSFDAHSTSMGAVMQPWTKSAAILDANGTLVVVDTVTCSVKSVSVVDQPALLISNAECDASKCSWPAYVLTAGGLTALQADGSLVSADTSSSNYTHHALHLGHASPETDLLLRVTSSAGSWPYISIESVTVETLSVSRVCEVFLDSSQGFGSVSTVLTHKKYGNMQRWIIAMSVAQGERVAIVKVEASSETTNCDVISYVTAVSPAQATSFDLDSSTHSEGVSLAYGIGSSLAFSEAGGGVLLSGAPLAPAWQLNKNQETASGRIFALHWCSSGQRKSFDRQGYLPFRCESCQQGWASHGGTDPTCVHCEGRICQGKTDVQFTGGKQGLDLVLGGEYQIDVRATTMTGETSVSTSRVFKVDWTPPSLGRVADGLMLDAGDSDCNTTCQADIDYTNNTATIPLSWNGWEDFETGVAHYLVSAGSSPGSDDVVQWTKVSGRNNVTLEADLQHGQFIVGCVVAVNHAGLASQANCTSGFFVDLTPPVVNFVFDGYAGPDIDSQTFTDSFMGHWGATEDIEGSLHSFEFALSLQSLSTISANNIGSIQQTGNGFEAIGDFKPIPTLQNWETTDEVNFGLSLQRTDLKQPVSSNQIVYVWVRCFNKAGGVSAFFSSNGVKIGKSEAEVDPTVPTAMGFDTAPSTAFDGVEEADVPAATMGAVEFPPGSTDSAQKFRAGTVEDDPTAVDPAGTPKPANNFKFGDYSFSISALDDAGEKVESFRFAKPIKISMFYRIGDTRSAQESSMPLLHFFDTAREEWINAVDTCVAPDRYQAVFPHNNTYVVNICHLTQFAVFQQLRPAAVIAALGRQVSNEEALNLVTSPQQVVALSSIVASTTLKIDPFLTKTTNSFNLPLRSIWTDGHVTIVHIPSSSVNRARFIADASNNLRFNGSASIDPDGRIVKYAWSISLLACNSSATQAGAISSSALTEPLLQIPLPDYSSVLYTTLRVEDDNEAWGAATYTVRINVRPHVAGSVTPVLQWPAERVSRLSASGTHDSDGAQPSVLWSVVDWPQGKQDSFGGRCDLSLPERSQYTSSGVAECSGKYTVRLTAIDAEGGTTSEDFGVLFNEQPTAVISPFEVLTDHSTFNISGQRSTDNTFISSSSWILFVQLDNPSQALLSAVGILQKVFVQLTQYRAAAWPSVTESQQSGNASLWIPVPDQSVWSQIIAYNSSQRIQSAVQLCSQATRSITLNMSVSQHGARGDILQVNSLTSVAPFHVVLFVYDNNGGTSAAAQSFIPNERPVLKSSTQSVSYAAVGDQFLFELDTQGSYDPDGSLASYAWSVVSAPRTHTESVSMLSAKLLKGVTSSAVELIGNASTLQMGGYTIAVSVLDNAGSKAVLTFTLQVVALIQADGYTAYPAINLQGQNTYQLPLPGAKVQLSSKSELSNGVQLTALNWRCVDFTPLFTSPEELPSAAQWGRPQDRVVVRSIQSAGDLSELSSVSGFIAPGVYVLHAFVGISTAQLQPFFGGDPTMSAQGAVRILGATTRVVVHRSPAPILSTASTAGFIPAMNLQRVEPGAILAFSAENSSDPDVHSQGVRPSWTVFTILPTSHLVPPAPNSVRLSVNLDKSECSVQFLAKGRFTVNLTVTDEFGGAAVVGVEVLVAPVSPPASVEVATASEFSRLQILAGIFGAALGMVTLFFGLRWCSHACNRARQSASKQPRRMTVKPEFTSTGLALSAASGVAVLIGPQHDAAADGDQDVRAGPQAEEEQRATAKGDAASAESNEASAERNMPREQPAAKSELLESAGGQAAHSMADSTLQKDNEASAERNMPREQPAAKSELLESAGGQAAPSMAHSTLQKDSDTPNAEQKCTTEVLDASDSKSLHLTAASVDSTEVQSEAASSDDEAVLDSFLDTE